MVRNFGLSLSEPIKIVLDFKDKIQRRYDQTSKYILVQYKLKIV